MDPLHVCEREEYSRRSNAITTRLIDSCHNDNMLVQYQERASTSTTTRLCDTQRYHDIVA